METPDIIVRPVVKLQLRVADFEIEKWLHCIAECEQSGIRFVSLAELGDNETNRRRLYELNKECSADISGRGEFYTYEEYREKRLEVDSFTPAGVILALQGEDWVGMAALSYHKEQDVIINAMTGVVRAYRRRGIATCLKILTIQFADSVGVPFVFTYHAVANLSAIAMNRRLGYVDRVLSPK